MGRGRAKAKQTKVARRLKYQTLDTDFDALQRELGSDDFATDGDSDTSDDYSRYFNRDDGEPRRQTG